MNPAIGADAPQPYLVIARKYRPQTLGGMIGQDVMVRTLNNAIASGRLAHAYILTGVRGVGKTTTARILARGLNCTGPDGQGGPTANPCGQCESCRAIAEDRHVDIIEMDAASRTGVNDIRELIEGVRYRPVSARYKIYIIDEVHMLSNSAFNALLKTLEEPPPHVKFIFATTEIRKVPVTVLSRCQRFDLRRIDAEAMAAYFATLADREGVVIDRDALLLIARAADGSVRDGQSLLDQAIARAEGPIGADLVRDMLGLADRGRLFHLLTHLIRGEIADALGLLRTLYDAGADPATIIQDLLEITHGLTRMKYVPDLANDPSLPEAERSLGHELSQTLGVPALARLWQMLLKGLQEVQTAPQPIHAAEMILIRIAHLADTPPPGDLVRRLSQEASLSPRMDQSPTPAPPPSVPSAQALGTGDTAILATMPSPPLQSEPLNPASAAVLAEPKSFDDVVALAQSQREMLLHTNLVHHVHLVHFAPGHIALRLSPQAPKDLPNRLATQLRHWTGQRWVISVSADDGAPTLAEKQQASAAALRDAARAHPLVQAVLQEFPGAEIVSVQPLDLVKPDETPARSLSDDPLLDESA